MTKKFSLTAQIFTGMALGIIVGLIMGPAAGSIKFIGDIFVRLLQLVVIPLIFLVLSTGVASLGDIRKIGRVGGKVLLIYEFTSLIAILLGLGIANILKPGQGIEGMAQAAASSVKTQGASGMDLFMSIFPKNPFDAMARGDTMQVVFFAILFGISMGIAGARSDSLKRGLEQLNEVFLEMVKIIIRLAPIGVFAFMAWVAGTMGIKVMIPLAKYLIGIAIACLFMIFIVSALLVKFYARLDVIPFFKKSWSVMLVAFSTCSAAATLPLEFEAAEKMGIKKELYGFTLPLGAMNQDGTALYQAMAAMLIAQFYGVELTFGQQFYTLVLALLASSGTFAVPGGGLITLMIVLGGLGLPLEGMALVAGVDRIADMFRTTLNVVDDMACTLVVAKSENALDINKYYESSQLYQETEN